MLVVLVNGDPDSASRYKTGRSGSLREFLRIMKVGRHTLDTYIVLSCTDGIHLIGSPIQKLARWVHAVISLYDFVGSTATWRNLTLLPAASPGYWEVIYNSWTVFTGG